MQWFRSMPKYGTSRQRPALCHELAYSLSTRRYGYHQSPHTDQYQTAEVVTVPSLSLHTYLGTSFATGLLLDLRLLVRHAKIEGSNQLSAL